MTVSYYEGYLAPRDETEFHAELIESDIAEEVVIHDPENQDAWIRSDTTMRTVDTTRFR